MDETDFAELLSTCVEVAELCPQGAVFIGGIAVYLHAINASNTEMLAATTHDADLFISLADMADLRDVEEITANRRLNKRQMIKRGFEFDLYVERQSNLIVPYDAIVAYSTSYPPFRVASLEHLCVLKLEAFADRRNSAKGEKDAQDLLRIAAIAARGGLGFKAEIAAPHIRDLHLKLLADIERGPFAVALARGNVMEAKKLRRAFSDLAQSIQAAYGDAIDNDDSPARK